MKSQEGSQVRRPALTKFARNLRAAWKEMALPTDNATVVVGVSGGADSTALFLALDELIKNDKLQLKLVVAHLDHGLRESSVADARWVTELAMELGHKVVVGKAQLKTAAGKPVANLEQAARLKRYDFLLRTAIQNKSKIVLTAHTLDDQAETVLLRLLRGSAAEGLSGTLAVRPIKDGSSVKLARPLVSWARRSDTEEYCRILAVAFRVDEMNDDETFSRVRIRKQLLPLMESFNNRIVEALSRTASLLAEDATVLSHQAGELLKLAMGAATNQQPENIETKLPALNVKVLLQSPAAVRRRALRQWLGEARGDLQRLEMSHLLAVEKLLTGRGGSIVELPGSFRVTRNGQFLKVFNSESAAPKMRQAGKPVLPRKKPLKKRAAASKLSRR
ncbi:MAG: tRNA(Ile)-lysidine synthase [Pyrinomonadaceae bacterium]|nr:tRNA(Ile)-lysidine synthase [Pyrinomonadaceae bacterium]